jgi:hypothetical protein
LDEIVFEFKNWQFAPVHLRKVQSDKLDESVGKKILLLVLRTGMRQAKQRQACYLL